MSNLKKVLSLAIAVMMVMGLMTTAFAAEAKAALDYSDSQFQDEAMLLNELNIIVGGDSGKWDGARLVTRGEFCKMICVAMNGGVDNPALYTNEDTTGLTDITDHWARGYIVYCYKLGIVSGWNGTFSPNTSVTGVQAAKILLTALGYDAVKEGYQNVSDWELNINVKAGEQGLYDGLGAAYDPRQALSRDFAAKMIANAFNANMVYYDQSVNIQLETLTFGQKRLRLKTVEGVLVANEYASIQWNPGQLAVGTPTSVGLAPEGKSRISIRNSSTGVWSEVLVPASGKIDDLGKSVNIYVRYKTSFIVDINNPYTTEDAVEKVFGAVAPTARNKVYSTARGFAAAGPLNDYVTDNKIRVDSAILVIDGAFGAYGVATSTGLAAYVGTTVIQKGDTLTLIDNNDDRVIDYAIVLSDFFANVTNYDTARERVTFEILEGSSRAVDFSDVLGVEDIKLDDKVLYLPIDGSQTYLVTPVTPITGVLTGSTTAPGNQSVAIVSGNNYQFANESETLANGKVATWGKLNAPQNYGEDVTYWVDKNGFILDFKGADTLKDYCVVTDFTVAYDTGLSGNPGKAKVSVLKADGSKGTYDVRSIETSSGVYDRFATNVAANVNTGTSIEAQTRRVYDYMTGTTLGTDITGIVFAYIIDEDAKTIDLRKVPSIGTSSNSSIPGYNKGTTIVPFLGAPSYTVNDDSAFFIYNSATGLERWMVYVGRANVPNIASGDIQAAKASVINSAKPGLSPVVGAVSFMISSTSIVGDTTKYAIVATTPVLTGSGSTATLSFKGIYKGEAIDMKSAPGEITATGEILKGDIITFNGDPLNFRDNEELHDGTLGSTYTHGYLLEASGNNYTIGKSFAAGSDRRVLAAGAGTFFTGVIGSDIEKNYHPHTLAKDPVPDLTKFDVIAVLDTASNSIIDLVYFDSPVGLRGAWGGGYSPTATPPTMTVTTLSTGSSVSVATTGTSFTISSVDGFNANTVAGKISVNVSTNSSVTATGSYTMVISDTTIFVTVGPMSPANLNDVVTITVAPMEDRFGRSIAGVTYTEVLT